MSVSSKIKKRVALLAEVARRFPVGGLRRSRSSSADLVFWAHHRYPESWLGYVGAGDLVLKDTALLDALLGDRLGTRGQLTHSSSVACLGQDARLGR